MTASRSRRWPLVAGAVAGLVLAAAVAGVLLLDRLLLSAARAEAARLSERAGRAVTVEGVATRLWGGLGVRVTGLAVGPAQGEDRPLASLRRAEVRLDLWRALRTRGRELQVREAVLEGLRLDLVRFPDGSTNAERLARRLAETAQPAGPAPAPGQAAPEASPLDLAALRVDRAAVENARIAFLDRTVPGATELSVDDLDVEVRDLAAGRPLEVRLAAAVLAASQNLAVSLRAAPLPPTLAPTFTDATVRIEPVDLSPILPFLPASVGLRAGRLRADVEAALGAAAGGSGPTRVKAAVAATGLAFLAQEGGRPFDVTLDLDAEADTAAGDLRLGRLDLAAGPAGLTGRGRVSGLRGEAPRVEGLEVVARGLDLAALSALAPPLRRALGDAVVAGPIGLSLKGGGTAEAQRLVLAVDLTPVRLEVPGQLRKATGAPASLTARLDVAGGSRVRFDAALDLGGVDLRPGGAVAKAPGDRLALSARGSARLGGGAHGATEVALDEVGLDLLGDRLTGRATASLAGAGASRAIRFEAGARGDRLDLDRLLLPAPPGAARPEEPAAPYDPEAFAGLAGTATVRLGTLRTGRLDVKDVVLKVVVAGDQVTLEQARLAAFGGTVKADGTKVALASEGRPLTVRLDLAGVAGKELIGLLSKLDVLDGRLDATVELSGRGLASKPLLQSLTGSLGGTVFGGLFKGTDLVAGVTAPLAARLPFAAKALEGRGATPLGKALPFSLAVADGRARLLAPLQLDTGRGALSLEGTFGLDGTLDLPATLALAPEAVSALTLGKVRLDAPLPIGFRVAGPAWKPRLEAIQLDGAVKMLVAQAASQALGKAGVDASALQQKAAAARAEAEAQAAAAQAEARARLEAEAARLAEEQKAAAEAARKKLEAEAKKRLEGLFGR